MATKDIELINKIFELLSSGKEQKLVQKQLTQTSAEFVAFFTCLIPEYKKRAASLKKEWKGEISLFGGMREQDGNQWSSREYVRINGSLELIYEYHSSCGDHNFHEKCIAVMTDEETLAKITYFHQKCTALSSGKVKVEKSKKIDINLSGNLIKSIQAAHDLSNFSVNL